MMDVNQRAIFIIGLQFMFGSVRVLARNYKGKMSQDSRGHDDVVLARNFLNELLSAFETKQNGVKIPVTIQELNHLAWKEEIEDFFSSYNNPAGIQRIKQAKTTLTGMISKSRVSVLPESLQELCKFLKQFSEYLNGKLFMPWEP